METNSKIKERLEDCEETDNFLVDCCTKRRANFERQQSLIIEGFEKLFDTKEKYLKDPNHTAPSTSQDYSEKIDEEDDKNFTECVRLVDFKPSEIRVLLKSGRRILVEAKQVEPSNWKPFVRKEFRRTLLVPDNVNIDLMESAFDNYNKELRITAPYIK